jgi:hypothetical protein
MERNSRKSCAKNYVNSEENYREYLENVGKK